MPEDPRTSSRCLKVISIAKGVERVGDHYERLKAHGKVLARSYLMDHVWGYHLETDSRTLDTHVRRLRDKLGSLGVRIHTVRGVGYRYDVGDQ